MLGIGMLSACNPQNWVAACQLRQSGSYCSAGIHRSATLAEHWYPDHLIVEGVKPGAPPHHTFTPLKGGVEGVDVWMPLISPHIHTLPHHTRKGVELLVNVFYRRNACHSL